MPAWSPLMSMSANCTSSLWRALKNKLPVVAVYACGEHTTVDVSTPDRRGEPALEWPWGGRPTWLAACTSNPLLPARLRLPPSVGVEMMVYQKKYGNILAEACALRYWLRGEAGQEAIRGWAVPIGEVPADLVGAAKVDGHMSGNFCRGCQHEEERAARLWTQLVVAANDPQ